MQVDKILNSRTLISDTEYKESLNRKALLLSYFTLVYNFLEGLISVAFGILSGSIALVGFGLDSFIESLSGGVMVWRFFDSNNISHDDGEKKEAIAIKLVAYSFFVFGIYVLYESVKKLYFVEIPDPSLIGIVIAIISIIVMPVLYYLKNNTGRAIGSISLVADSKQTLACVFLSFALLVGLGLNYIYGLWWSDPVVGLLISAYLFIEGYKTLNHEELNCC